MCTDLLTQLSSCPILPFHKLCAAWQKAQGPSAGETCAKGISPGDIGMTQCNLPDRVKLNRRFTESDVSSRVRGTSVGPLAISHLHETLPRIPRNIKISKLGQSPKLKAGNKFSARSEHVESVLGPTLEVVYAGKTNRWRYHQRQTATTVWFCNDETRHRGQISALSRTRIVSKKGRGWHGYCHDDVITGGRIWRDDRNDKARTR